MNSNLVFIHAQTHCYYVFFLFFNYNFIIRYVWVQKGVCCVLFEVVQQLDCNMGDSLCMYYM